MPQIDQLEPATTGLVVVDVQNAFAHPDSPLADRGADLSMAVETVPRIRNLLDLARAADLPVAFTRSLRRADGRDAPSRVYDVVPGIYRDGEPICCAGDWDADYVDGIEPRDEEYEVGKLRYDGFRGTPLATYLRGEDVETVLVCGVATNVCVESTARSAYEAGFNVIAIEDCCAAFDEAAHAQALENVEQLLGTTMTTADLQERLPAKEPQTGIRER